MNPKDDETSLGRILLELEIINEDQLRKALDRQENSSLEQVLGMVLVHEGYCTKEDIDYALSAQESMRAGRHKEVRKAVAAIDFAIQRKTNNGARAHAIEKAAALVRTQSGQGFQAITPELLAKGSGER